MAEIFLQLVKLRDFSRNLPIVSWWIFWVTELFVFFRSNYRIWQSLVLFTPRVSHHWTTHHPSYLFQISHRSGWFVRTSPRSHWLILVSMGEAQNRKAFQSTELHKHGFHSKLHGYLLNESPTISIIRWLNPQWLLVDFPIWWIFQRTRTKPNHLGLCICALRVVAAKISVFTPLEFHCD